LVLLGLLISWNIHRTWVILSKYIIFLLDIYVILVMLIAQPMKEKER
jgi:hypothetical protein